MPPAARSPRLAAIQPDRLAAEVVGQLVAHLGRYAVPLSPGQVHVTGVEPGETDLAHTIRDLCAWAQRGEGRADDALDAASTMAGVLYARPLDGAAYEITDLDGDADPSTEVGLLLVAALARCRLHDRGGRLTVRDLAALGSLSTMQVRTLVRQGEIEAQPEEHPGAGQLVTAAVARRWLSGRGVAV